MRRRTTGLPSPSRTPVTPSPASTDSTTGTLSARRLNRPPPTRRERKRIRPLAVDLPEETSLEVVKALIDAGAGVNAGRQWRTHLGEFVTKGHLEVADLLILHGADVNRKNDRGKTTLQAMIYPPSWLERYGDPVPGIELLLANGADINTLSDDGNTALDIAIEQENEAVAALLRERGGLRADELS